MNPPLGELRLPLVSSSCFTLGSRTLHREWKKIKPYLPKSTSLPALQLVPRDRPRYICCRCGFANFYDIPLCVWCATRSATAVRAFEKTIPRTRTASAPPRVFWTPNELSLSTPRFSTTKEIASGPSCHTLPYPLRSSSGITHSQENDHFISSSRARENRRPQSAMEPLPPIPAGSGLGRPGLAHKRSHSQPNALRLGHRSRPYYSAIRKDTSSSASSDARLSVGMPSTPRPASPLGSYTSNLPPPPISRLEEEVDEFGQTVFAFVSPTTVAMQISQRSLPSRISRRLASPVSALHSMNRAAEMREELAALVRESNAPGNREYGTLTARLRKFRRSLKGLMRRKTKLMD
ncbi:hypothetical protein C8R46DRAFT_1344154 [Mycena filopes]|nr:hypothetical protein C8R46DRAFT_1344154 [Mycena filopes]